MLKSIEHGAHIASTIPMRMKFFFANVYTAAGKITSVSSINNYMTLIAFSYVQQAGTPTITDTGSDRENNLRISAHA